jgi:hypothetical protein
MSDERPPIEQGDSSFWDPDRHYVAQWPFDEEPEPGVRRTPIGKRRRRGRSMATRALAGATVLGVLGASGLAWSTRRGGDASSATTSSDAVAQVSDTAVASPTNVSADTTIPDSSILVNPIPLDADGTETDTGPGDTTFGPPAATTSAATTSARATTTTKAAASKSTKRTTTTKSKGRATTTTTLPPLGDVVTVADEGISMRLPIGWKAVGVEGHPTPAGAVLTPGTHREVEDPTALAGGVILYAVDVAALDVRSPFVSTLNIIKVPDIAGATLTTLQNQARQGLIDIGSKVTASEIITLADRKVIRIRYSSATNVPGVQYWFTTATKAWILTFNYRAATLDGRRIDASAASLNI